ncbi:MAG: N-acetylmuramic acid 6-phosphate etherase [Hyphomicrobiales bacterium]|nr:N-acetylmuramic acid 6-phosphate etherase [Hyphomicrobiales bacterium]
MSSLNTEKISGVADGLDQKSGDEILSALHEGQIAAAVCIDKAIPQIERAANVAGRTISSGRTLAYAGAGSSGLMALADGLELPGTFGIPHNQISIILAGGINSLLKLKGGPEDNAIQAEQDLQAAKIKSGDCVICLSASGATPYTISAAKTAKLQGASTVGIANNVGAQLLDLVDVPILLETPPELVAGSTRMGAATAQKVVLNMISTLMAVQLGYIHDGFMVNLQADNIKLKNRAQNIVGSITGCSSDQAACSLDKAGGSVKIAILLCSGAADFASATRLLESTGQQLRPALLQLERARGF